MSEVKEFIVGLIAFLIGAGLIIGFVCMIFWAWPTYNIWASEQGGKAALAGANFSRQTRVAEAKAKQESAELEGQAELTRAEFTARANKVLTEGLGGPEGYLRWMYINMLAEQHDKSIIYIPTEAGLPILESGRVVKSNPLN